MGKRRLIEKQWQEVIDLRMKWQRFCDCDLYEPDFIDRMEAAGFVQLRAVRKSDIDGDPFAADRGIEPGGMIWALTAKGRRVLAAL